MLQKQQPYRSDSPIKQITDEQINECMQFCAMYNILYAMHKFPIPLKNIDQRKKVRTSKVDKSEQSKKESKKQSKFEKPRTTKNKNTEGSKTNYQPSQVQKYNYQEEDDAEYSRVKLNKVNQTKQKSFKKVKQQQIDESSPREIDLAALITGLAVGGTSQKDQIYYSDFSKGSDKKREDDFQQSRLHQTNFNSYQRGEHNNEPKKSARSYYYNQNPASDQNQYQISNPYHQASYQKPIGNYGMYDLNSFMSPLQKYASQMSLQSPYSAQIRGFNNIYPPNRPQNMPKNLFPNRQFRLQTNPSDFQYHNLNAQNQINRSRTPKNNKYIENITFQQFEQQGSKIYQTPAVSNQMTTGKRQFDDERSNASMQYMTSLARVQSQYPVQNTPPKMQTPSNNNRSLSPLGNSASCRNFFAQTSRDVSVERSGVSRSKSRRKEKAGGSKSFYQPSLSARKVVLKQREEEDDASTYSRPQQMSEQDLYFYNNRQRQVNTFNREDEEEKREEAKKMTPKQYPRNTRQTEFTSVSGWQQRNNPQKTTKSQQIINPKNSQSKKPKNHHNTNKKQGQSPILKQQIQRKYDDSDGQRDSDEVNLDDLEEQMQKLNTSRRKAPNPITQVDLTNISKPVIKMKR